MLYSESVHIAMDLHRIFTSWRHRWDCTLQQRFLTLPLCIMVLLTVIHTTTVWFFRWGEWRVCMVYIKSYTFVGTKCWLVKKFFEHKMKVTEMRMLSWMCRNTLMDQIRNQELRDKLRVALISAKMHENRLRWLGHVWRKTFDAPARRIESIIIEGKRSRGKT